VSCYRRSSPSAAAAVSPERVADRGGVVRDEPPEPPLRIAFALFLLLATLALPLGLTLPLIALDRLYFFTQTPSLLGVIAGLWIGGDRLLAAVVGLVSVAFPVVKLAALHLAGLGAAPALARHLHALGRWSMMDVLLVALVIFAAKTSGFARAASEWGLWAYAVSTLAAAIAGQLLERIAGAAAVEHGLVRKSGRD